MKQLIEKFEQLTGIEQRRKRKRARQIARAKNAIAQYQLELLKRLLETDEVK